MKREGTKIFALFCALLFVWSLSLSQVRETGTIQGNVTDEEGAPLPGVTITVSSPGLIGGDRAIVTDAKGFYRALSLAVAVYSLKAEMPGFNTIVKENQSVKKGEIVAEGACMSNGSISLGRPLLVALMPYEGYNFEDGCVISESVVKENKLIIYKKILINK